MPRTKKAGKQIYSVVIAFVYTIESRAFKTRIVIKITIKIRKDRYKVRILVNSSIKANYIKRRLALDISILLILRVIPLILLEEKRIYLYKNYILEIITKNILEN